MTISIFLLFHSHIESLPFVAVLTKSSRMVVADSFRASTALELYLLFTCRDFTVSSSIEFFVGLRLEVWAIIGKSGKFSVSFIFQKSYGSLYIHVIIKMSARKSLLEAFRNTFVIQFLQDHRNIIRKSTFLASGQIRTDSVLIKPFFERWDRSVPILCSWNFFYSVLTG